MTTVTSGSATELTASGLTYMASGVLTSLIDQDFFKFFASGVTSIFAEVDDYISNADLELRLYNSSGSLIGSQAIHPIRTTRSQQEACSGLFILWISEAMGNPANLASILSWLKQVSRA
ncbi:MAG: hypothetical protein R3C17_20885 [Planctomycetaceae bacterium]